MGSTRGGRAARLAWAAAACRVGSGIVFTVSGPTRPSTYSVSGYAGFLTPVEAQSGRWTGQPASRSAANSSPAVDALERLVGGARVGEARLALQLVVAERGQPLVDLRVDAGDEERRDGVAVERAALGVAPVIARMCARMTSS